MENDSFEKNLRELLREPGTGAQSGRALERALKSARRQTGIGALLVLSGRALESALIGLESASSNWKPVSRLSRKSTVEQHKAE